MCLVRDMALSQAVAEHDVTKITTQRPSLGRCLGLSVICAAEGVVVVGVLRGGGWFGDQGDVDVVALAVAGEGDVDFVADVAFAYLGDQG